MCKFEENPNLKFFELRCSQRNKLTKRWTNANNCIISAEVMKELFKVVDNAAVVVRVYGVNVSR